MEDERYESFEALYIKASIAGVVKSRDFSQQDFQNYKNRRLDEPTRFQIELECKIASDAYVQYLKKLLNKDFDEEIFSDYLTRENYKGFLKSRIQAELERMQDDEDTIDNWAINDMASAETAKVPDDEAVDKKEEFTAARQVLAMHLIFKHLQLRESEIDQIDKARFVRFLTGKSQKNIYDLLRNPFSTKEKHFRSEDLQYIRTYFEKLKLTEIVKSINNYLSGI